MCDMPHKSSNLQDARSTVLEYQIWRFLDSAGTEHPKITGTNEVTLLFPGNLGVQLCCLSNFSVLDPHFIYDSQ